jgi:chitin synthase
LLSWRAFYSQTSAFLLAFKGIQVIQKEKGAPLDVSDFFANTIFRNIVVSLLATFGLYVAASVIFVSLRTLPCTSNKN